MPDDIYIWILHYRKIRLHHIFLGPLILEARRVQTGDHYIQIPDDALGKIHISLPVHDVQLCSQQQMDIVKSTGNHPQILKII